MRAHAEVGGGEAPLVRTPTPDTAHHHHNVVTEMVMAMVVMVELITGVTVLVRITRDTLSQVASIVIVFLVIQGLNRT